MSKPKILETTIRDGSYEVGFHFTRRDVAALAALLDRAGFSFIEVGHGNGLGGEVFGDFAAASDEEYLETARRAVTRAKLGALLGFTSRSDDYIRSRVELAARCGLDYIRMGMVPRRSDDPIIVDSVELAKKLGLTVSINFMRTYCATPAEIEERSRRMLERGADWIYVVDSAGGMSPEQVAEYVRAIGEAGPSAIGYHGHNNTQRAFANSLAAVDAGASMVDTSLQGLGRATGNAQTELVLTVFQEHYDSEREIDRNLVYKLGRRVVRPLIEGGFEPTNVLAGALNVHSSSLKGLAKFASEYQIELDDVLATAGRKAGEAQALDRRDLPDDIVVETCKQLTAGNGASDLGLDEIAAHCAEHAPQPPADGDQLLAALKVAALRDHLAVGLVVVPERWGFDGFAVWRGNGWALGVVPADQTGALTDFAGLSIARVFTAAGVSPGPLADRAPVQVFDFHGAVAEAAVVGCELGRSVLVAIADPALRAAVAGRLAGRDDVSVVEDAGAAAVAGELILEGTLGAAVLDRLAPQLEADHAVTLLGDEPVSEEALGALSRTGCQVRVANFLPLLLVRHAASVAVRLAGAEPTADLDGAAIAVGSQIVDASGDSLYGPWRPLAARGSVPTREITAALERRRLEELIR